MRGTRELGKEWVDVLDDILTYLSLFGSVFIVITYLTSKKWREKLPFVKHLICVSQVFTFFGCWRIFLKPEDEEGWDCYVQALIVQFATLTAMLYPCCIAIETMASVSGLVRSSRIPDHLALRKQATIRKYCYHTFMGLLMLVALCYLSVTEGFGYGNAYWCWLKSPQDRLVFAYIPLWLGWVVTIICNTTVIVWMVQYSKRTRGKVACTKSKASIEASGSASTTKPSSGSGSSSTSSNISTSSRGDPAKMTNGTKYALYRLILETAVYLLLTFPGSVRRLSEYIDEDNPNNLAADDTMHDLHVLCISALGFASCFLVWVCFDTVVQAHWARMFGLCWARLKDCCRQSSSSARRERIVNEISV